MTEPSKTEELVAAVDRRPVRFGVDERTLLMFWLISGLLHGLGAVGFFVSSALTMEAKISFEESRGVALMSRLGYLDEQTAEEVGQPDEIAEDPEVAVEAGAAPDETEPEPEEETEELAEGSAAEVSDPTEEEPVDEEPVEPEQAETPEDERPDEPSPEVIAAAAEQAAAEQAAADQAARERRERQAQARRERQEREAAEAAERERIEEEERRAAGPDMNLPPSDRYPEGTLNPIATDVSMWGPESARLSIVIRNDRIRRNQHRDEIEQMLTGLPDWNTLAGGANIDPFDDVDAMLIASSDPRLINRTFFVGVHRIQPQQILERLERGFPGGITWEVQSGSRVLGTQTEPRICPTSRTPDRVCDPRVFYVPTGDLFIFTRPEFLADLQRGAPRARNMDDSLAYVRGEREEPEQEEEEGSAAAEVEDGTVGRPRRGPLGNLRNTIAEQQAAEEELTRRRVAMVLDDEPPVRDSGWISGLRQIADFGGTGSDGPAFMMSAAGFDEFELPGLGRTATPQQIHITGYLESDPRATGRMIFENQAQAEAWVENFPNIIGAPEIGVPLRFLGLYGAFNGIEWEVDHNEATFVMVIPRATLESAATQVERLNARRHADE
jgi:hypothetical protein